MADQRSVTRPVDPAEHGVSAGDGEAPEPAGWALSGGSPPAGARSVEPAVGPDRATLRLALVVGGLALAVLLGFGLGRVDGRPTDRAAATVGTTAGDHSHAPGTGAHQHDATAGQPAGDGATGLSVTSDGYTLTPSGGGFAAGRAGELRFQIRDAQRRPVTRFAVVHDKPMHLIVVRRDLTGFQHLHPTMAADGTWSIPLTLPQPGVWRAYTDFTVVADDGRQTPATLGVDLVAPGDYTPRPLPAPATRATVAGFTVDYAGTPQVGTAVPLRFQVRDGAGRPAALERYLGAYGHLVALREGDLGYLHVHPEPGPSGDTVTFWLTAPGPGSYRMYLDFQVAGVVRTAEFTLSVG
ncbi:hypothetical protein [Micromonospora sp. WMMD987]|uniref:hypothetical protein n=1 Tax=Micromonospora sp. WMMD987 TaxID=3016089 RepID=UPI00249A18CB|nr:hypothetical protein [Micromonospora sp. WMMD987]WFE94916.1 hypothetical protein O7612_26945 [Micromonospora sp. WMMD987]